MKFPGAAEVFVTAGSTPRRVDGRSQFDLAQQHTALAVASGMVNVFVAHRRADKTAGRRIYLGTVTPGGMLPALGITLAESPFTLIAIPDGPSAVISAPSTGDGVSSAIVEGTEAFARVMLPFDSRVEVDESAMRTLLLHAAKILALETKVSLAAMEGRRTQPAAAADFYERSLRELFSTSDEILSVDLNTPPLLRACRHVAAESGVPLTAIPRRIPTDSLLAPEESFARAAGIGCRQVRLPDEWWKGNFGALFMVSPNGEPIALIPGRWNGYRAFTYSVGRQPAIHSVDASFACGLSSNAVLFAPALPTGTTTIPALLSFLLRGSSRELWLASGVSMAASALNLAVPFATGLLVSKVIPAGDPRSLLALGFVLAATVFAVAACELVNRFLLLRVETRASTRGSSAVLLRALQLPLAFFQRYSTGDLAERLGVVEEVQRRITGTMIASVFAGVFSLTYLVLMAFIDPFAAACSGCVFFLILVVTAFIARRQSRFAADAANRSGQLNGFALQLLEGIDRIRTTGTEERALLQWLQRYRPERRSMYRAALAGTHLRVLSVALPFVAAGLLWLRFNAMAGGEDIQVPAFLAFSAAFAAALASITALGYAIGDISEVTPLLARLKPILEEVPETSSGAEVAPLLSGAIAMQSIRFTYEGSATEALRSVSIEASAGDFIAVVGTSGSGKSTLVQLLLGLRKPASGKVLYDGLDLAKLDLGSVRRQIGVVAQHPKVIPGTILENITGAARVSLEDAWQAAEDSGLASDIREMPMQMQTFIQEQTISGGQLQKLLIARALVNRPRILIFDEATSSLDEVSQAHVSASLTARAVTRIVIAHRLSTVRNADRIYVLSAGEVVQTGRFDELAVEEGPFRELVRRQLLESRNFLTETHP